MSSRSLPDAAADLARNGDAIGLGALLNGGLAVDAQDAKGNTLLMLASYHGRAEVVKLLLKSGATVDLRNDKGQTPLGGVAFKGYVDFATLAGKTEILALLQARRDNAAKPTRWFSKLIGWVRR